MTVLLQRVCKGVGAVKMTGSRPCLVRDETKHGLKDDVPRDGPQADGMMYSEYGDGVSCSTICTWEERGTCDHLVVSTYADSGRRSRLISRAASSGSTRGYSVGARRLCRVSAGNVR